MSTDIYRDGQYQFAQRLYPFRDVSAGDYVLRDAISDIRYRIINHEASLNQLTTTARQLSFARETDTLGESFVATKHTETGIAVLGYGKVFDVQSAEAYYASFFAVLSPADFGDWNIQLIAGRPDRKDTRGALNSDLVITGQIGFDRQEKRYFFDSTTTRPDLIEDTLATLAGGYPQFPHREAFAEAMLRITGQEHSFPTSGTFDHLFPLSYTQELPAIDIDTTRRDVLLDGDIVDEVHTEPEQVTYVLYPNGQPPARLRHR